MSERDNRESTVALKGRDLKKVLGEEHGEMRKEVCLSAHLYPVNDLLSSVILLFNFFYFWFPLRRYE